MYLLKCYVNGVNSLDVYVSNHYAAKIADYQNTPIIAIEALPACRHFQLKLQVSLG